MKNINLIRYKGIVLLLTLFFFVITGLERASAQCNTVDAVVNDMKLCGEALPHGLSSSVNWSACPRIGSGNNPGVWRAMVPWGQVYETAEGNRATNTRVQLKDIEAYYLSKADNKWHLWVKSVRVSGDAYVEDFSGNSSRPADIRYESDNSISITAGNGYNFHFWSPNRATINPDDIKGVFTTCQARLIPNDASKPDDRATAKYILSMGGDYWKDLTANWVSDWSNNGDIGIGRFKYVTSSWQAFNMHSLTEDQLRQNPPPMTVCPQTSTTFSGTYLLTARHSGKALDINSGSLANEAVAIQWPLTGGANQRWKVEATGNGYYKLTAQHSGKCLDVSEASTADGAKVQQYTDNGNAAQRWKIEPTSDGYYKLTAQHSGKCLDVKGVDYGDGARLQQWTYSGGLNQQWKLEAVNPASSTLLSATAAAAEPEAQLLAYPNPTGGGRATLALAAARDQRVHVQLSNQLGQVVRTLDVAAKSGHTNVELPFLPAGLYVLRAQVDGQNRRCKLQVQ